MTGYLRTFLNSNEHTIARLKQVLEAAAFVQGNRQRFLDAGLIDASNSAQQVQLSTDWQNAFFRLRPIDKQTIRSSPGLFLASADDVVYRGTTSGSRGQFFVYFAGKKWNEARIKARRDSLAWWGIGDHTPIINVASRLLPVRPIDSAIAGELNQDFLQLLVALLSERPAVIRGYPSRLCEVASQLSNQTIPKAIAVICTGECLFDYQQTLLETVFQSPVINEYGCQETGIFGLSCPEAGRLHLDNERCLYEVIDGELVTTDLFNLVMPLVRYKCGDIIDFYSQSCACGRPGLTGKILGRIEDTIDTVDGIKYTGDICLPPFKGILNYQVVRTHPKNVAIKVQVSDYISPKSQVLQPLINWTQATFGNVSTQFLLVEPPTKNHILEASIDDHVWIKNITQKSWSSWLNQPLPSGYAKKTAQLLKKLTEPIVVVNSGIATPTLALLYDVLNSPTCPQPEVEKITARVLLFACSFLADNPKLLKSVYIRAAERLKQALNQTKTREDPGFIDLLIPSLFVELDLATKIWHQFDWHQLTCQIDTFNIHNLLSAFETTTNYINRSLKIPLNPIVSVLIEDLNFFVSRFGFWLLAHWFELMHQQPVPLSETLAPPKEDVFATAWLKWRQSMINGVINSSVLVSLELATSSDAEKARFYMEKGYSILLKKQQLELQEWLEIIKVNAQGTNQRLASNEIDLMGWLPIVRSLVLPLLANGEPEMAYQCLVASAAPSSRLSAFERIAFQVNDKQSVISQL